MVQRILPYASFLNRLGEAVGGVGLLFMTGLVTVDVIMRRLLNAPIIFADEVAGYMLVLVTMMGLGYALQEGAHIQVRIIVDHISEMKRAFLRLGMCFIGIIYTGILFSLTGQLSLESYHLNAFAPTPSQLPLFPFQVVMPIGCLIFFFQLVGEMIHSFLYIRASKSFGSPKKD